MRPVRRSFVLRALLPVAAGVSGALVVSAVPGLPLASPAAAADADASSPSASSGLARPDSVSASVTARVSGHRVEDLSQRTESSQVFANPDGSWTTEAATEPEFVKDATGTWHDIDTSLVERDGHLEPKYAAADLSLPAEATAAGSSFATLHQDGKELDWRWPTALPAPTVEGNTATYPDVVPGGGDLVVTATPTGFSHDIVLDAPPAAAVADPDGQVSWTVPVATQGADLTATAAGGLAIAKDDGTTLATAPAPLAYDATVDPATGQDTTAAGGPGTATGTVPVDVTVGANAAGMPTMTLSADSSFLTDPETTYPVTIDPAFTTQTGGDSWIDNSTPNTSHANDGWLDVGDGGTHVARAFLHFGSSQVLNLSGKHVLSATMQLRNYFSNSCTAATILAQRATSSWTVGGVTWNNQPTVTTTGQDGFAPAYGASGCASNWASWNVTDIVAYWAAHADSNHGIRVMANNEANPDSWRQYRSLETTTGGSVEPKLTVTYNTAPTASRPAFGSPKTTYAGATYTSNARPTVTTTANDADGGNTQVTVRFVNASTGAQTATCTTSWFAAGAHASCAPATALPDATYQVSARAYDSHDYSAWSGTNQITVLTQAPAAPSISCPGYANKSWTTTVPGGTVKCTIATSGSAPVAPVTITTAVDATAPRTTTLPASPAATATVSLTAGQHTITATANGRSGLHTTSTYVFGLGTFTINAPAADGPVTTTGAVGIDASGPPDQSGATTPAIKVKWRLAASGDDENTSWTDDATAPSGLKVTSDDSGVHVRGTWDSTDAVTDAATSTTLDDRKPNLLDLEICVEYAAGEQCSWTVSHQQILRVAHAFGDGFPTTDLEAGPDSGQAALWTGEASFDATDADLPAGLTDLTISRTLNTLDDPASYADNLPATASHVFGKGWAASLDGPDDGGYAGWQVYDSTRYDGTIDLVDTDGDVMVFGPNSGLTRRTSATFKTDWIGLDPDTAEAGTTAKITGTGAATTLTVTDIDGTSTTFTVLTAPAAGSDTQFQAKAVHQPGDASATSYSYDTSGRVTRILAPVPTGVTCPATGTLPAGCRALQLDYATATTATSTAPGDYKGQVTKITALVGGSASTVVATYAYDSIGRLVSVTDPRNSLTTGYTYDGSSYRLASITPPGQTPINYAYNSASSDHPVQLVQVTRERPTSDSEEGTADLTTIVYHVPTNGEDATNAGLPDLSTDAGQKWGQSQTPAYGAAVFGPDHEMPATTAASDLSASDWTYAGLSYTDDRGYTINTAEYGAGDWRLTATDYDTLGNPVRELDENDIAQLQADQVDLDQAGTYTWYNAEQRSTDGSTVTLPADSIVTDTYSPAYDALVPDADGHLVDQTVRTHTHTDYDQGAPNNGLDPATGQAYALPTTVTTSATDPANAKTNGHTATDDTSDQAKDLQVLSVVKTGYDNAVPGGAADAGWSLGLASTSTTVMGDDLDDSAANITTKAAYNTQGQVVSSSQPDSNGDDPGTTETVYYTADNSADADSCDSHPAWAGLVCQTKAAGNPSAGPAMITTFYDGYNDLLQPTSTVETATNTNGTTTTTRTTTTSYLPDGRTERTATTVDGLDGSAPIPATTYDYDDETGLPTATTPATGDPITTAFDAWGRQTSYQIGTGTPTLTTYDKAGRTQTVTDSAGTITTYAYDGAENTADGTDLAGHLERRGLPTQVSTTSASNVTATVTGAYDAAGNLVSQKLPGGLTQNSTYDTSGQLTQLTYTGDITSTDDDGNTTTTPDVEWLSWGQAYDAAGRIAQDWTPTGAAYQGETTGTAATGYAHQYAYDRAGRLTQVIDQTALATSATDDLPDSGDPDPATVTGCVIRRYAFDHDGNRTSLTRIPAAADGTCQTGADPTGTVTQTWDHNLADRITNDGYAYDNLGRTTTIPAADTPQAATGISPDDLTIGYYDDDTVHTLTQVGQTTTYQLDAAGRPATQTTGPASGTADGPTTSTTQLGYVDDSDSPAWETTTTGTSSTREVYATGLDDNLAATLTTGDGTSSLEIAVNDPHGDTVTQITIPTNNGTASDATGIDDWSDTDEYGNPLNATQTGTTATNPSGQTAGDPATSDGGLGYGWTGAKQRATSPTGVLLMGARLYNPVTGTFTAIDPVPGGNTAPYAYPQDPVNGYDLEGQCWGCFFHKVIKTAVKIAAVCQYAPGAVGTGCSAVVVIHDLATGHATQAAKDAVGMAAAFTGEKLAEKAAEELASKVGRRIAARAARHIARHRHVKTIRERATKAAVKWGAARTAQGYEAELEKIYKNAPKHIGGPRTDYV